MRGVRARVGNIQIGGEGVFDDLFTEQRFNRWCVGEVHIMDSRITPNARRDYFEPSPHLRNLENRLIPVLRDIGTRCRRESTARNRARKALSALCDIEDLYTLATSGYLTSEDSVVLVQKASREVEEVRKGISKGSLDNGALKRLDDAADKLNEFPGEVESRRFDNMDPVQADICQRMFGVLVTLAPSPRSAIETIESVVADVSRVGQNDSGTNSDQRTGDHSQNQTGPE